MFNEWLLARLQEKNWSQAQLSRASGLTTGAISNYINGRTPDKTALQKIAKAFKLKPEIVFRAADLLPPSIDDPWVEEQAYKLAGLDGLRRKLAESTISALQESQENEDNNKEGKQTKPAFKY